MHSAQTFDINSVSHSDQLNSIDMAQLNTYDLPKYYFRKQLQQLNRAKYVVSHLMVLSFNFKYFNFIFN